MLSRWSMPMETVVLHSYNPFWKAIYLKEAESLGRVLSDKKIKRIEHYGSTSIEGMISKPIIDIIIGLDKMELSREDIWALDKEGYRLIEISPYCQRYYFQKRNGNKINLSVTEFNSPTWKACLDVRDYLKTHPEVRAEYSQVKRNAIDEGNITIERYSVCKQDFLKKLTERARAWRSDE